MRALIVIVVMFVATIGGAAAVAATDHPDPGGPRWTCQQDGHLYSWDCIAESGFLYGGMWAYVSAYYEHPNPATDQVVGELYFNQNSPHGMTQTAQWRHRLIAVDDAAVGGLVAPYDWRVTASQASPPAPVTCLVLTGPQQGQRIPCGPAVARSVLHYWYRAAQIPGKDAW